MSTDIVERLRFRATAWPEGGSVYTTLLETASEIERTEAAFQGVVKDNADLAREIERLRAALRRYAAHDRLCAAVGAYGYCSCGLQAILDSMAPAAADSAAPAPSHEGAVSATTGAALDSVTSLSSSPTSVGHDVTAPPTVCAHSALARQCGLCERDEEIARLRAGLKFYAEGSHFGISDRHAWDTVTGEPQNWYCDEAGTATIEDGTIAKHVLSGYTMREDAQGELLLEPPPGADGGIAGMGMTDEEVDA